MDGRVMDVVAEVLMSVLIKGGVAVVVDVGVVVAVGAVVGDSRTSQSTQVWRSPWEPWWAPR